ncbi:MAG: GTP 3',8-cyclase MoaA [Phycisphaerales bacterium]
MTALPIIQPKSSIPALPPAAPGTAIRPGRLFDSHGRTIRDVRLSVTDRCNFRCVYCMDPDFRYMPKSELLTRQEYLAIVRACISLGITKIRLTGGEPTLYSELDALIQDIHLLRQPDSAPQFDLSITTNGSRITEDRAKKYRALGLDRMTFSLDSLDPVRAQKITRSRDGTPDRLVRALAAARAAGLEPLKVNAVIMRGFNDDELVDFATFAREQAVDMRFIEFMPLDSSRAWSRDRVVSADEMLRAISARYSMVREEHEEHASTSMNYRFADGAPGRIGLIAPVTQPFCGACSRLRITADGKVRPCLFSHQEWDVRTVLRSADGSHSSPALNEQLQRFLIDAVWTKQAGHGISSANFSQPARSMSSIGG